MLPLNSNKRIAIKESESKSGNSQTSSNNMLANSKRNTPGMDKDGHAPRSKQRIPTSKPAIQFVDIEPSEPVTDGTSQTAGSHNVESRSSKKSQVQNVNNESICSHQCPIDGNVFESHDSLLEHMYIHSDMRLVSVSCMMHGCDWKCATNLLLAAHLVKQHNIHRCRCWFPQCGRSFPQPIDLSFHVLSNHPKAEWKCAICGKAEANHSALAQHMHRCHVKGSFKCAFKWCHFEGNTRQEVVKHLCSGAHVYEREDSSSDDIDEENSCESTLDEQAGTSTSTSSLTDEIVSIRADEKIDENTYDGRQKIFRTISVPCTEDGCDWKFGAMSLLNDHLAQCHQIHLHRCLQHQCGKSFEKIDRLYEHIFKDHSSSIHRSISWKCTKCDKDLTNHNALHQHVYLAHYKGRFECTLKGCDFVGNTRQEVTTHFVIAHPTGRAPVPAPCNPNLTCSFCGKVYKRKGRLDVHLIRAHKKDQTGKGTSGGSTQAPLKTYAKLKTYSKRDSSSQREESSSKRNATPIAEQQTQPLEENDGQMEHVDQYDEDSIADEEIYETGNNGESGLVGDHADEYRDGESMVDGNDLRNCSEHGGENSANISEEMSDVEVEVVNYKPGIYNPTHEEGDTYFDENISPAASNNPPQSSAAELVSCSNRFVEAIDESSYDDEQSQYRIINVFCLMDGCNWQFEEMSQLHYHMARCHKILQYRCLKPRCGQSFDQMNQLNVHILKEHSSKSVCSTNWKCAECGTDLANHKALHQHMYECHYQGRFMCSAWRCHFVGNTRIEMVKHYRLFHTDQGNKCNQAINSNSHIQQFDNNAKLVNKRIDKPIGAAQVVTVNDDDDSDDSEYTYVSYHEKSSDSEEDNSDLEIIYERLVNENPSSKKPSKSNAASVNDQQPIGHVVNDRGAQEDNQHDSDEDVIILEEKKKNNSPPVVSSSQASTLAPLNVSSPNQSALVAPTPIDRNEPVNGAKVGISSGSSASSPVCRSTPMKRKADFSTTEKADVSKFLPTKKRITVGNEKKQPSIIITKSLTCTVEGCGEVLKSIALFNHHQADRHNILPFRCLLPQCGRSFKSVLLLNQHHANDHPSAEWKCANCGSEQMDKKSLYAHQYFNHVEGSFGCAADQCDFVAVTRVEVNKHYRLTHVPQCRVQCADGGNGVKHKKSVKKHQYRIHNKKPPLGRPVSASGSAPASNTSSSRHNQTGSPNGQPRVVEKSGKKPGPSRSGGDHLKQAKLTTKPVILNFELNTKRDDVHNVD